MTKNVVITGASSGIGAALAHEFASRGYNIALCARRIEKLESLKNTLSEKHSNITVMTAALDVNELDTVPTVLSKIKSSLGNLDIVIANAGITGVRRTGSGDLTIDKNILQTNLFGAIATIDAAVAIFREQGFGQIVGMSSFSAFRGIPGSAAYSASKAALTNYLQAVGTELFRKKDIKVTVIHPGFIRTEIDDNIDKFPFVIDADKAARTMVNAIEKGKSDVVVPSWPWAILRSVMPKLPESVVAKIF
ncbi:MAG: SDR family oxidoreductase [Oleispira sp.]|nr:SDR family oxidoreductase [Oleispira sp.]